MEPHPISATTRTPTNQHRLYRVGCNFLKHHPIEPQGHHPNLEWGFWDNFLEHHPNFWNTTPLAQQREHQPVRVGILVQHLDHHPIEPQSHHPNLEWGFWDNFLEHHPQLFEYHPIGATTGTPTGQGGGSGATFGTHHPTEPQGPDRERGTLFDESLRSRQEIIMSGPLFDESRPGRSRQEIIMCVRDNPPKTNTRPSPRPKQPAWGQYYGARSTPLADPIHRTIEPDVTQSVHPCDI